MFFRNEHFRIRFKKVILLSMILILLNASYVEADTYYKDILSTHWIRPILDALVDGRVIEPTNTFNLGSTLTKEEWIDLIQTTVLDKSDLQVSQEMFTSSKKIKRIEALEVLIVQMGLEGVVESIKQGETSFIDAKGHEATLQLAIDMGWISLNATKLFRPDALLTKEESYALIYNVYKKKHSKLEILHSYYAISSYNQIELTKDLDLLTYGWGRLEFSNDQSNILINMTGANNNEYRVPTGYTSALSGSSHDHLLKQLMLFVKEEVIYDQMTNKSIRLADYILMDEKRSESVANQIVSTLLSNAYNIKFDGVFIDFEGLKGQSQAANFNRFLKQLESKLSQNNLMLTVAVHPVRQNGQSYYDGYDYKTIGAYADYVVLMAHDYEPKRLNISEMAMGYTVTPLAPLNEIYVALKAITDSKTGVEDASKVLLQFSMDSVQWKLKDGKIIHEVPYRPTYAAIQSKLSSDAINAFSIKLQSPYLIFDDVSDGTRNVVWYENTISIQAKVDMAKAFNLGGISVWRLGSIPDSTLITPLNDTLDIWRQIKSNFVLQ